MAGQQQVRGKAAAAGAGDDDFEALLEQHLPQRAPREQGELLDATVVRIGREEVLVTYGSKAESAIPIEEFRAPSGELTVKPGDALRVLLVGWDEEGDAILSYKKARSAAASSMLREAAEKNVPVRGTVARVVNGGVIVDVGIPAFMPQSQIDVFRGGDLSALVGQEIEAYVLEYKPQDNRAVLSRRKLLTERQDKERQGLMGKLQPGATVSATVKEVLDFGVFVTLGGSVEGLVPRSELTYDRGVAPGDVLKPGQQVELKVLELDAATGRITLSRKRVGEDPWLTIEEKFPVGATVTGKVTALQSFGAFVQLEEGITGLVHAKDMSWEAGRKSADERYKVGDVVTCQVQEIDKEHKRLSLSVKHLSRDPWLDVADKFKVGSRHRGTVTQLRDFGAFVKLDENTEALLHIGDLSWEKRHAHPSEVLKEGEDIEVVILSHDAARRRIGVGMKQTTGSPIEQFLAAHPMGSLATGKVKRIVGYGAFLELAPGLEGLIHISELDEQRVDSPERVVRLGEEVTVKVLEADQAKGKVSLSKKAAVHDLERENIKAYAKQEAPKGQSAFAAALAAAKGKQKK